MVLPGPFMIIETIKGKILMMYDAWNLASVRNAEDWIIANGFIIYSIRYEENGLCIVTVRERN